MTKPKTGGRKRGTPNKATATAREAIAMVADGKAHDFMRWLEKTAKGTKTGKKWLVRPNPGGAAKLYLDAIEYHIPKLARTEHTGKDGGPVVVKSTPTDEAL